MRLSPGIHQRSAAARVHTQVIKGRRQLLTQGPDAPDAVQADGHRDEEVQNLQRRPVACQEEHEQRESQRHQLEHVVISAQHIVEFTVVEDDNLFDVFLANMQFHVDKVRVERGLKFTQLHVRKLTLYGLW
jgi:hypothetical protein